MSYTPTVGDRWKVNGTTYRVASLKGDDPQYPIVMIEVEREPGVIASPRRMRMTIEARWFERSDIKRIVGNQ